MMRFGLLCQWYAACRENRDSALDPLANMRADFTMSDGAVTALPPHANPIGTDPTETVGYSL